jgi:hypothetical protein
MCVCSFLFFRLAFFFLFVKNTNYLSLFAYLSTNISLLYIFIILKRLKNVYHSHYGAYAGECKNNDATSRNLIV